MQIFTKHIQLQEKYKKQLSTGSELLLWCLDDEFPMEPHYIDMYDHISFDPEIHTFVLTVHLLYSAHGIYMPKIFSDFDRWENITDEDRDILSDPENVGYWETWESVLDKTYIVVDGLKYEAEVIDGDLYAIHYIKD